MSTPIPELDIHTLNPGDITRDQLTKTWDIHQLKRGHRFSADDIFTAYFAARSHPNPKQILDLGAGIGTVGLLTLSRFPAATLTMVEAQQISHQLAKKTIHYNSIADRVEAIHADLRTVDLTQKTFDIITGSPPYFPTHKAVMSPHPQRAACRMELRGSIVDYAQTAARYLKEDGVFVVCFAANDERAIPALAAANLHCRLRQDVVFRADLPPTISIFVAQRQPTPCVHAADINIRDSAGQWTKTYDKIRKFDNI